MPPTPNPEAPSSPLRSRPRRRGAHPVLGSGEVEEATQTEDANTDSTSAAADRLQSLLLDDVDSSHSSSDSGDSVMSRLSRLWGSGVGGTSHDCVSRGTQTVRDPLTAETERLAYDIVFFTLGRRTAKRNDDEVARYENQLMLGDHNWPRRGDDGVRRAHGGHMVKYPYLTHPELTTTSLRLSQPNPSSL